MDELIKFLEEENVEISFQAKRNFTNPKLLSEYIRELEGAVCYYSRERLDYAMKKYRGRDE